MSKLALKPFVKGSTYDDFMNIMTFIMKRQKNGSFSHKIVRRQKNPEKPRTGSIEVINYKDPIKLDITFKASGSAGSLGIQLYSRYIALNYSRYEDSYYLDNKTGRMFFKLEDEREISYYTFYYVPDKKELVEKKKAKGKNA